MKIGIFGGSFNPPHIGHVQVASEVAKKMGLDLVYVIPNSENPLKEVFVDVSSQHRLAMTQLAFKNYSVGKKGSAQFKVIPLEIERGGKSYTIDTLKKLKKEHTAADEFFLIIGMDSFLDFPKWKSFKKLLAELNLVVVSRPGSDLPSSIEDLPKKLQSLAEDFEFNQVQLSTEKTIEFLKVKDIDISASMVRKRLRSLRSLDKFLPLEVEKYIREHKLYQLEGKKIDDYASFTRFCVDFLNSKKAINIKAFDLRNLQAPSEFSIVTSGTSTKQTVSLAENLVAAVKDEYGMHPLSVEGKTEGRWVLVDYGPLIVHIFYDFIRQEYSIESLWKNGTPLESEIK